MLVIGWRALPEGKLTYVPGATAMFRPCKLLSQGCTGLRSLPIALSLCRARMSVIWAFALIAFAGGTALPAHAEDPLTRQEAPTKVTPDGMAKVRARDANALPLLPPMGSVEEIWNNLWNNHQEYIHRLGGVPPWQQPEPSPGCGWHFFADGGFYMVQTYFNSNPAFLVGQRPGPGAKAATVIQARDFDYGLNFAPRVVVGFLGENGLGLRAAWWRLEETEGFLPFRGTSTGLNPVYSSPPMPGIPGVFSPSAEAQLLKVFNESLGFDNFVQLQVWDGEGIKVWRWGAWDLFGSGGVRYAYVSQGYRTFRSNSGSAKSGTTTFTLPQDSDILSSGRSFAGVGPTAAVELRRRLGWAGLSVYGMARGSALFGREHDQAFELSVLSLQTAVGTAAPKTTTTRTFAQSLSARDRTTPMVDAEVGVNWAMPYGRALVYTQLGFLSQTWFGAGSATGGGALGFFGLHFSAGVTY